MTIRLKPSYVEWTSNKLADALKNWSGNREQLLAAADMLQYQAQEIENLKSKVQYWKASEK
jgi:DNA repair ATPase RecN